LPAPAGSDLDATAFNIATSRQRNVLELAASVGEVMGQKPKLEFAPPRPGELFRSALDVSKARKVLGWTPDYVFEDGLRELVDWFKTEAR
jgi:nucleoside-diphosphate-sugar epimerase